MAEKRRPCARCGRNRAERFFTGPRGKTCSDCRRHRVRHATRNVRLQDTYGITQIEYEALLAAQGGVCAICKGKRPGNLDVDHDHALVKAGLTVRESIRGLLCRRCNRRLLPASMNSPRVLSDAIAYLIAPPAQEVLRG